MGVEGGKATAEVLRRFLADDPTLTAEQRTSVKKAHDGRIKRGITQIENTAKFWLGMLKRDTDHTEEQLSDLLSTGNLLGEEGMDRILENPRVSIFLEELAKLSSAAGSLDAKPEVKATWKGHHTNKWGRAGSGNNAGKGFAHSSSSQKYIKVRCSGGKVCGDVEHQWQVRAVPKPRISAGQVVPGYRVDKVLAHAAYAQYNFGKKKVSRCVEEEDISDSMHDGVDIVLSEYQQT